MDIFNTITGVLARLTAAPEATLAGLLFFLAVVGATLLAMGGVAAARGSRRRDFMPSGHGGAPGSAGRRINEALQSSPVMRRLARHALPDDETARTRIRLDLARAGFRHPSAVSAYVGLRLLLAIVLPALLLPAVPLLSRHLDIAEMVMVAAMLGLLGYLVPVVVVTLRARQRQRLIREGFPEALDLMVVCVEAGLGLDETIVRVAREMEGSNLVVAEELILSSLELRAGRAREDALRNLAARTGVDEVAAFATLLIQSDQLGTSVAEALRVYADDMRARRLLRAEEKAQRLPVMMALPLALFLLPSFMLVLMMPVMLRIFRVLLKI